MPAVFDPLELYAAAIDASDYVGTIAPVVRGNVPAIGALLDIGAGGGQLGAALREPGQPWTTIEPSSTMQRRLQRLPSPPEIVACDWQAAEIAPGAYDTVFAATMPAFLEQPGLFLDRCRTWARRAVVWVVPAHAGPRGLCFAGCLPAQWHGEDETPGIEIVLRALPAALHPHAQATVDWAFTGIVPDLAALAAYLADRLGWPAGDERRPQLAAHLSAQATPHAMGSRLCVPRKSAVLVWGNS